MVAEDVRSSASPIDCIGVIEKPQERQNNVHGYCHVQDLHHVSNGENGNG